MMGYDTRPLLTLDEKDRFLKLAADQNYFLLLEHWLRLKLLELIDGETH